MTFNREETAQTKRIRKRKKTRFKHIVHNARPPRQQCEHGLSKAIAAYRVQTTSSAIDWYQQFALILIYVCALTNPVKLASVEWVKLVTTRLKRNYRSIKIGKGSTDESVLPVKVGYFVLTLWGAKNAFTSPKNRKKLV